VIRAQADAITVRACAARVEDIVREKASFLEATRGKEAEANQRASALWGELVAARRERDVAEEKVLCLVTEAAMANQ
jgi:hypothetical protein